MFDRIMYNQKVISEFAKKVDKSIIISLDFDGTCVTHQYPEIGETLPNCVETIQKCVMYGALIVLNTMRGSDTITPAINWFVKNKIPLYGIGQTPNQSKWTDTRKAHAHVYIDDAAFGCPLTASGYVNWYIVGPQLIDLVTSFYSNKLKI